MSHDAPVIDLTATTVGATIPKTIKVSANETGDENARTRELIFQGPPIEDEAGVLPNPAAITPDDISEMRDPESEMATEEVCPREDVGREEEREE